MRVLTPRVACALPLLLCAAGCAMRTPDAPAADPPVTVTQPAPGSTPPPRVATATPEKPKPATPPAAPTAKPPQATAKPPQTQAGAKPPQPPAKAPQPTAKAPQPATKAPAAAAQTRVPPAPALDLDGMKARLRATKGIGLFTKLALKNQVDDLLDRFRDHYSGKDKVSMAELRRSYDMLMMKVLSLLQDADQQLASAIVSSREAIWSLLADPKKFAELNA